MTLIDRPPTTKTAQPKPEPRPIMKGEPTPGRRFGYMVSIAVNAVMLFIANNLMEWEWFPWLTNEYDRVLSWIAFGLGASIVVTAMYMVYDLQWFKSLTQAALALVSVVVTVRIYMIFPFDFSAYEPPWTGLTEAILIFLMIGAGIAAAIESTRFMMRLLKGPGETP